MARPLAKSPFVLLALCLWILACPSSLAKHNDPNALNQQVNHLIEQRKYHEAIPIAERAVEVAKRTWGSKHPKTADALNNLGVLFQNIGDYAKAEPLYKKAFQIDQKVLGPEHPKTATTLNNLALIYEYMSRYAEAEPLLKEALQIRQKVLGPEHPDTAATLTDLASHYFQMSKYDEAEPLCKEALQIRQKVLGPEHPDTAISLSNLATLYLKMIEYAKAEPIFQDALRTRQKVLGAEHAETATSLGNLARLYGAMGEYAKAEPLYQEALRIRQKVLGAEHADTVTSLNNLGALYRIMGAYTKAEPLYQEMLRIRQKVLGPEHADTASSLNDLAVLYHDLGEYAKAEPLFQEALRVYQNVLGAEHADTATSLNNLAMLYATMGEYAKAEPLLQEALRIRQKILEPEHSDTAESLNNLALLYQDMGEYAKAEPLCQEALRIRQKVLGAEHPYTATSLHTLATLYKAMGEYAKAEPLYQEALRIRQKVSGAEHPDTTQSLHDLAMLYHDMGEYTKAEPLFQEALRVYQKVLGAEHPDTADNLNNLALLYHDMGEYAKAEPLYQEALRIRQKILGPAETANILANLASLYLDMGEYAKAEPLCQEALRIRQKVLGAEHPDTATSLNNLAMLYATMGEYAKAEPLCQEALRILQKVLGPEHPNTAHLLDNLAFCEFDLGRIDEATAVVRQASAAKLTIISKIFSFTSEEQRLAYLNIFYPYNLFSILKGTETDLAAAVLRYKGVVLDSIVEDRLLAEASDGSEDQKLVEQLNLDKRRLDQLLLQPAQKLSAETNQRIEALEAQVEKIESKLAQHIAGLGQARHALGVSLEQVQSTIPNDGALIEYLRYPHHLGKGGKGKSEPRYGAIVLLKGAPLWIPLGKANEIEHLVRRYGTLVRGSPGEDELSANLQALYKALWAPIGQALPSQTKRIIISPDGQLNFISFATLLTKDKQFLAQTYDVQYVASGRDLLRDLKPSTSKEVVLFANPDFDLASTPMLATADNGSSDPGSKLIRGSERGDIEDWSFGSLEGTQKERDELIQKFAGWHWTPTDFTAKEATKEALLKIHSPYILHLATHGFFAKEDPSATKTEPESPLNDRQSVTKSKFFKNPMHRSGLALAGAQTTIEAWKHEEVPSVENDGILTAEDVSTLDLQGTWLVTLSACDTGSGEARAGEGVMGLRRGFIQAGAQNLLMTLWPISDEVTVKIMSDFYEAAHNSGNAPEALAEVQREWLLKLRTEEGLAQAVNLAGPFIMSSQGKP
jgi:tetratricopeptide (TPR) repeat protein